MTDTNEQGPSANAEPPGDAQRITAVARVDKTSQVLSRASAEADNSPAGLIRFALVNNASVEEMRELVGLQREMSAEMAKKAYHKDMAEARAEMSATIKRNGYNQHTKSKFVLLCDLVEAYAPVLARYGFNYSWVPDQTRQEGWVYVTCVVTHRDGHSESYPLGAPEDNVGKNGQVNKTAVQGIGSVTSYLERYTFQAAFGVAASDSDNDGNRQQPARAPERTQPMEPFEAPHENSIARLRSLLMEAVLFEQSSGKTTKALQKGVNDALDDHSKGQLSHGRAGVIIGKAKAALTSAGWTEPPEWTKERAERNKAKRAAAKEEAPPPEPGNDPGEPPEQQSMDVPPRSAVSEIPPELVKCMQRASDFLPVAELFNSAQSVIDSIKAGNMELAHAREEIAAMENWLAKDKEQG